MAGALLDVLDVGKGFGCDHVKGKMTATPGGRRKDEKRNRSSVMCSFALSRRALPPLIGRDQQTRQFRETLLPPTTQRSSK